MASKKKQKGMVLHQEGATTFAAVLAANHPPAGLVALNPGKASEGGMQQVTHVTSKEADMTGKPNMYPTWQVLRTSGGLPVMKHPASSNPQSDNLSPDSIYKGIKVTLDNNSMWNEFFRCNTEMILTKQGSRMFPYCRFRISGLQPSRKYCLIMDIQPQDNSRYKWTGKSWQVCGKAECHVKSQPFPHPESPSDGQYWTQNPVSFYKLKLTSNISDQEGNTVLHPMHRYLPRLHVVQTEKAAKDVKLNGPNVVTFTFPQTEFMAVTAYQNSQFAQLKVDYNPFAKGLKEDGSSSWALKLKSNTSKDSHKDEGTTSNKQHPVKKSLKSLLANHKPRSSKVIDSKQSAPGDLQKNPTMNKDRPAAKVTGETSCSSLRPPQKLISELIREAHVSLQRCNLEQLSINNDTAQRTKQTNTKTTVFKGRGQDVPKWDSTSVKTHIETSPAKEGETVVTQKVKEKRHLLNSLDCKDTIRTDFSKVNNESSSSSMSAAPSVSQNVSVDLKYKSKAQTDMNVKPHKRPVPLPLPALALFLKQHSTKCKKVKSKLSPPQALSPESLPETPGSAAASASPPSDCTSYATYPPKDLGGDIAKPDNQASDSNGADLHPDKMVLNLPGQAVEMTHQLSSPSCLDVQATPDQQGPRTDDYVATVIVPESSSAQLTVPHGTPVLPKSDQPFCTIGMSLSTISSTLTTSSASSILSPPFDTVLPTLNTPQTPTLTESSTLPSDFKSPGTLLPDPECSPFGFETLSPTSSLEPLPSLPASIALELDSTTSELTPTGVPPEELPLNEDSAISVFKWHTVLPPPEPYVDTSFRTFQPTPQTLPLASVAAPLLPSQTPAHPASQTLDATTSTPHPDPTPSFQENEQSLPFPAELSPLTLQLPLSPTFSSLDGDALSPTPSIADLVHFFSTDDDLGMGVEFPNTEAVPVPYLPPCTVEAIAHDLPQQVQPTPAPKPSKCKKSWRRKVAKADVHPKTDDSTYTSMQPSLEEVEEQLFISFTSKEALKLHVVDSPEGLRPVTQTQKSPEVQQPPAEEIDNDKSMDAADNFLPDCINPNNFPAKLWRLVNNPANRAICWDSCGEVIIIDEQLFRKQILSPGSITSDNTDAFRTTNFSSFIRQLNLYGFRKADPTNAAPANAIPATHHHFFNPNFKRNHSELLVNLKRLTVTNKAKLQAGLDVNGRPPRCQKLSGSYDGRDENMKRVELVESFEDLIAAFEKILLRDIKLMKHRQVIHPVLQEVGLKMNLLDATLSIDLQYLGVRLPIPPPGVSLELPSQELPPPQSVSAAFVSRTGKTTDVTQIKGWREKFTPLEALTPPSSKPEAAPIELNKKNLSAFCSDMLDEYLENEGKLIDERAASFSQPPVEPLVYKLPTRSSSYVRTLDSVLKQTCSSPTSDLISGFIPPSKRPKLTPNEPKTSRRGDRKQKALNKQNKPRPEPAATVSSPSEHTPHLTQAPKSKKRLLKIRPLAADPPSDLTEPPPPPSPIKRKKLKPKTWSQTLSPPPRYLEDMAPLESDSELGEDLPGSGRPVMTRALLKQRDLEDGVVWEGRHRTCITRERAAVALTSLFTLSGFVSENPTAPIQLVRRRVPPCLNEFCRLGCVCSSLAHSCKIGHCGRTCCMFGCSCLKQKVVLLKNLDGSDSSSSHHGSNKKRRRMKMAYILKEAESVSQPAQRIQTLWKRDSGDSDPDPVHVPEPAIVFCSAESVSSVDTSSCARVRGYRGKKVQQQKQKNASKDVKSKETYLKSMKRRDMTVIREKTKSSDPPPVSEPVQPALPNQSATVERSPKPSKRLVILAECQWRRSADRHHMLKKLCEAMSQDCLHEPFWFRKYLVSPVSQTVEENGDGRCIQYKIHISQPRMRREKPAAAQKQQKQQQGSRRQTKVQQVEEEAEPLEDWQQEVMEDEEPLEDWQYAVEEGDLEEEEEVHDGREKLKTTAEKKKMVGMALPLLTGISPAGFLSANRKQLGGTDHLIQVNGKLYPLAKIQLGKMGALHPANRLAAYLTGRLGSNKKQQGSSEPPQSQSSELNSQAFSSASITTTTGSTSITQPICSLATLTEAPPAAVKADQSAASDQSAGEAPDGSGARLIPVRLYAGPTAGASQVRVVPAASGSSAPAPDSVKLSSGLAAPKGSQLLMIQVPGPPQPPARPRTAQMFLKSAQSPAVVQYYRRPDGKLVQLVHISQLRPVKPNQPVQTVFPPTPLQAPPITVVAQIPATTVTTSTGASSSSSSSSSSLPSLPAPLRHGSGFLSQKGMYTFKILPTTSSKDHVIVSKAPPSAPWKAGKSEGSSELQPSELQPFSLAPLPTLLPPGSGFQSQKGACTFNRMTPTNKDHVIVTKDPTLAPRKAATSADSFTLLQTPPITLTSLKPSVAQGAELGVKTVTVSAVHQTAATPARTPPGSEVATAHTSPLPFDRSSPEPEPACDLVDLDIICVDDETGVVSREPVSGTKQVLDMVDSSSGETDDTSDYDDESGNDEEKDSTSKIHQRHQHNVLERQRRGKMKQLFDDLRTEVGLSDKKMSNISTLKKAVQVIQELKAAERHLMKRKRRLMKTKDKKLSSICLTSAESSQLIKPQRSPESIRALPETGSNSRVETDLTEFNLWDETDELTDNSSDEDAVITKTTNIITREEDTVQSIAVETVEEKSRLNAAQRTLASIIRNMDSKSSLGVKKLFVERSLSAAFRDLSSVMNTKNSSKHHLLKQARQEIRSLQSDMANLKSVKICLHQQRSAYIRAISQYSGKSEQTILRKLQYLSSKQWKHGGASAAQPEGGGASKPPAGDVAPPSPTSASVPSPVQQTNSQRVLNMSKPDLAAPPVSHNAPVQTDRPRTMPIILSRRKTSPAAPASLLLGTVEGNTPGFQALVPGEVLSLVGTALPGQQLLTVGPVMAGRTVLQSPTPGVASVTLNVPSLTNQQINLTSLPRSPTAANSLLHQVQPTTLQKQQRQENLPPAAPHPPVVSDRLSSQTDVSSSYSGPSAQGPSSSLFSRSSADGAQQDAEYKNLTSLLDEIVFLNQQMLPGKLQKDIPASGEGCAHSPCLLQLDSDSDDTVTMETEEAWLNGHSEMTQEGSANGDTKGDILVPPPLLQMKMGVAETADPPSSDGAADRGGGRQREGSMAWRPMPRLVPLGLRGAPPSS